MTQSLGCTAGRLQTADSTAQREAAVLGTACGMHQKRLLLSCAKSQAPTVVRARLEHAFLQVLPQNRGAEADVGPTELVTAAAQAVGRAAAEADAVWVETLQLCEACCGVQPAALHPLPAHRAGSCFPPLCSHPHPHRWTHHSATGGSLPMIGTHVAATEAARRAAAQRVAKRGGTSVNWCCWLRMPRRGALLALAALRRCPCLQDTLCMVLAQHGCQTITPNSIKLTKGAKRKLAFTLEDSIRVLDQRNGCWVRLRRHEKARSGVQGQAATAAGSTSAAFRPLAHRVVAGEILRAWDVRGGQLPGLQQRCRHKMHGGRERRRPQRQRR